jgi:hypothetical protein
LEYSKNQPFFEVSKGSVFGIAIFVYWVLDSVETFGRYFAKEIEWSKRILLT